MGNAPGSGILVVPGSSQGVNSLLWGFIKQGIDKMNHFVDTDPCRCHRSSETSLSPEGILAIRMIAKPCTVGDRSWKCGGITRKSCVGRSANTGRLSKSNPSRRCLRRKEEMEWPVCAALSDPDASAL